jgi:hypothetical protein
MGMAPVCIDMYDARTRVASKHRTTEHDEQRTLGGTVAYLLALPALVAVMAAPAVAAGAVLGVAGLALGERFVRRLRRQQGGSGLSPPEVESGRPA